MDVAGRAWLLLLCSKEDDFDTRPACGPLSLLAFLELLDAPLLFEPVLMPYAAQNLLLGFAGQAPPKARPACGKRSLADNALGAYINTLQQD